MVKTVGISLLVLACVLLQACSGDEPASPEAADRIFHNGRIYTANSGQEIHQAIAVLDDRIIAVGPVDEVMAYRGDSTVVTDLQGRMVLPGLHDTHLHPAAIIQYESCNIDSKSLDLEELSGFVAACLQRMAVPEGDWLTVRQWSFGEGNFPAGDYATLRQSLDAGAPRNPVILLGNDGHHNATNSLGLSLATNAAGEQVGLSAATLKADFPDLTPFVGVDERGEPNGAINEGSYRVLGAPGIMDADISVLSQHVQQLPERLNSLGITSIQDAAVVPALNALYDALLDKGPLSLRIRLAQYFLPEDYLTADGELDMDSLLADAAKTRDKYAGIANISANALKYFVDGVLEGNPLANPPTLPNAAHIKNFHQPRFRVSSTGQEVELLGYVDTDGEACKSWRTSETGEQAAVEAFMVANGYHPGQCQQSSGVMYAPAEVTHVFAAAADKAGFALHFHAIGDQSVRTAVDAIAAVTPDDVTLNRHSVTHLQLVTDEEIRRLGELKIPIAFTYAWARSDYGYDATVIPFIEKLDSLDDMYNPESYYYRHFYPANSIRKAGAIVAAGSDAPVDTDDPRPFENIEAAVTRDRGEGVFNPDERLAILDAIDAYTINGAKLLGQHGLTGSLETGKKADFIILDRDIVALAENGQASDIHETRVLQTWFDGRLVYDGK